MKILEKNQSELIARTEIIAEVEHTAKPTPSEETIKENLSKELKIEKDLIIIKHIFSKFGEGKSKIIAYTYKDKETLKRVEKKSKKQRKAEKEAAKKKAAPKEEKTQETKVKEPKAKEPKKEEVKENAKETNKEQENK
ncbi:MAG: hypothetical protein ABIH25_05535 [Candidatus Woesearchaeota archaeon]